MTAVAILIIIVSVLLIAAVLLQSGKDKQLSGAIAGGADTFMGKGSRAKSWDKFLNRGTGVLAVILVILVIIMCNLVA